MNPSFYESTVPLDKLDAHLKALLRLKIREFVHLSPWFKSDADMESIAMTRGASQGQKQSALLAASEECPHRQSDRPSGRRHIRPALHLHGVI
jgi:hypothetical protein